MYKKWTLKEVYVDFVPGFYFLRNRLRFCIIELLYSFDNSMCYISETGRINYLCLLSESTVLYGPIPEPKE